MASSRTVIIPGSGRKQKPLKAKGPASKEEKALVEGLVMNSPQPLTEQQITGMAIALRRGKDVVQRLIEQARENLAAHAGTYVEIHRAATLAALNSGTMAGLEVATHASQWAMEKIGAEGARVIDKDKSESNGTKVLVGIKLGGMNTPAVVEGVKVDAD